MGAMQDASIVIGREFESKKLLQIAKGNKAELVAILGRRRVGKTHLIKNTFKNKFSFQFTAANTTSTEEQLNLFSEKIKAYSKSSLPNTANNWFDAFENLKPLFKARKRHIVFLDELPWMDTAQSNFKAAFEYFWNDWAVNQNIVVIICGSATSWMIENIKNNKGGLHNRVSHYIHLQPFTLAQTEQYLKVKGIKWTKPEIAMLYMAIGGVPFYLNEITKPNKSAAQYIDALLFDKKSNLYNEFENLYRSLFRFYQNYELVVKALATKKIGLTRNDIAKITKISNGGGLTKILQELKECDFIQSYTTYGKEKKDSLYQLIDEYSLFYLTFNPEKKSKGWFLANLDSSPVNNWKGKAFELLCAKHIEGIKKGMGIVGIYTESYSYFHKGSAKEAGFQIDLLIERKDNVINICEAKYAQVEYQLKKTEAEKILKRKENFRALSKTNKQLFSVLISPIGLKINKESLGVIDHTATLKDLFNC
jgi:uncharacterized protein